MAIAPPPPPSAITFHRAENGDLVMEVDGEVVIRAPPDDALTQLAALADQLK